MNAPAASSLLSLLTAFLVFSWVISAVPSNDDFADCLRLRIPMPEVIYTPENPSYWSILLSASQNLRLRNFSPVQRPRAIVAPSLESQIQSTIYCSKKHDILIRVRSGGHDYEGLSYASQTASTPFAIVDLRNLSSILIDTDQKAAWMQAGATLGEAYYAVAQRSKTLAVVGGDCPSVGSAGFISGGGTSMLSRKFGLAADQVIDARIIDVNGQILDRSTMGESLFWAIRGGGPTSFGVISALKVNLHTVPEMVTVFTVNRTLEQNAARLVYEWQSFAPVTDENLMVRIFVHSFVPDQSGSRTVVASFTGMYLGGADELMQLMQTNFPQLGLVRDDCVEMSWIESTLYFRKYPRDTPLEELLNRTSTFNKQYFKGKSDYARSPISEDGLQILWDKLLEEDELVPELLFNPYGGKIAQVPDDATPFPHRAGVLFNLEYLSSWDDEADTQRHLHWVRQLYAAMTPHVSSNPREAFINYRDLDFGTNNMIGNTSYEQASLWGRSYFKDNFARLVWVKTMVDPANFFRNEQSIPSVPTMFPITGKASQ